MIKRITILIIVCFCGFSSTANAQKIYLVSVGISDYPGKVNDLKLPVNDASAMYNLYKENANAISILLTDKVATKNNILSKTSDLFRKAKENDIVVFFFSGHGYPGGYYAYDTKLSNDDVRKLFSQCKAKNKMIFADACFAGGIREKKTTSEDTGNNVMLFLSSRNNELSIETPRMKNGFFTACLVRCLKGGADTNRDRIITAKELYVAVSDGVIKLSRDKQHPVMWGNFQDNMPVMIWK